MAKSIAEDFLYSEEEASELKKEDFDKLWAINPAYGNDEEYSYENTFRLLKDMMDFGKTTDKGELLDVPLIYKRYKSYCTVKKFLNDGVDPKYQKKENVIVSLYMYLYKELYNSEETMPRGHRHYYFWEDLSEEEIEQQFNTFKNLCK